MTEMTPEEAERLVDAIVQLAQMADRALPQRASPLTERLRTHLGVDADAVPNTSVLFDLHEHVNVQRALDALREEAASWEEIGLPAEISHHSGFSLVGVIGDSRGFGPQPAGRQFVTLDAGVDETIACLRAGIVLTELDGVPIAMLVVRRDDNYPPGVAVEIAAPEQSVADAALARLRALIDEHNVFRGKALAFTFDEHGRFGLSFVGVPHVEREQVILPPAALDAIDEHVLGISEQRDALRAAGQHVKRGLLLYGPPGTGKTHTISYLLNRTSGRTTMILSGAAVGAIGQAGTIARSLQPATIVVEDVDLIAFDRSLPGGEHNSLLFQLLNEMDGLSGDADVLFILTTNRVDLLEPALAARPGRVDQAIEIGLPDADARRRLLDLYVTAALPGEVVDAAVERTAGFAAALIKELARRSTLMHLRTDAPLAECVLPALDALLEQSAPILRRTLAGDVPPDDPGGPPRGAPSHGGAVGYRSVGRSGWSQYGGG